MRKAVVVCNIVIKMLVKPFADYQPKKVCLRNF